MSVVYHSEMEIIMVLDFIEHNFVAVTITLFLMLFVLTNNNFERRTNRLFLLAAFCILILIFEETWEAQLAISDCYEPLRIPLSAVGYSLRPMVPFLLMLIAKKYTKKEFMLLIIPLAFNALVAFSALFSDISFSYTESNEFVRGPLGVVPFLVAAFYMLGAITLMFLTYKDMGMMEMLILSAILVLTFMATIIESIFRIQFIQCPSMATSITFYYLFLHSNQNNRDPLTETLTRRRFYLDTERYKASISAVISLDLNDLKKINDQNTHMEGDKALSTVANVIKRHKGVHASLYRTGGDEFIVLCYRLKEENVKKMISKIREDMKKTKYRCAIGYAMKTDKMSVDEACHIADNLMYENKRQMKGETSKK